MRTYTSDNLIGKFLNIALNRFNKHFNRWHNSNLLIALAGEPVIARHLASWLLGMDQQLIGTTAILTEHNNTEVNVLDVIHFLIVSKQHANYANSFVLRTFSPVLIQFTEGKELWSEDSDEEMKRFRA